MYLCTINLFCYVLQARELKSIHLDAEGHFVKLVLHKNHVNKYNIYNQVSCLKHLVINKGKQLQRTCLIVFAIIFFNIII